MIHEFCKAFLARTVSTAEELAPRLKAMAEDAALAVAAGRCHLLGGTLDAVECVDGSSCDVHLERHLVVVVADLANGHE
ncbi:hypothetical protein [Streptomyces sp. NPDC050564]|uniref:hypothetical protein n=1 Tax=Streptomyces sp. NPDC050564 TaxID=3365631 RepID=UPI00379B3B44